MISDRLTFLVQYLRSRSREPTPLSLAEMQNVASVLEGCTEIVRIMEERPVPPHLRVIEGVRPPSEKQ